MDVKAGVFIIVFGDILVNYFLLAPSIAPATAAFATSDNKVLNLFQNSALWLGVKLPINKPNVLVSKNLIMGYPFQL